MLETIVFILFLLTALAFGGLLTAICLYSDYKFEKRYKSKPKKSREA